ncbi:MAG TPA: hypothetical protein VGJ20_29810 [Xanthobacteraceae bacterium]
MDAKSERRSRQAAGLPMAAVLKRQFSRHEMTPGNFSPRVDALQRPMQSAAMGQQLFARFLDRASDRS